MPPSPPCYTASVRLMRGGLRLLAVTLGVITVAALLSGCCTGYPPGRGTVNVQGRPTCARHHTGLVTTTAYKSGADYCCTTDSAAQRRLANCYPNALTGQESLTRSRRFSERARVTYCPLCQEAVEKALHSAE